MCILLTESSRGIGRAIADRLARYGNTLALDAAAKALGGFDAVISNTGIAIAGRLTECDKGDWDRVFDVIERGAWLMSRAAKRKPDFDRFR